VAAGVVAVAAGVVAVAAGVVAVAAGVVGVPAGVCADTVPAASMLTARISAAMAERPATIGREYRLLVSCIVLVLHPPWVCGSDFLAGEPGLPLTHRALCPVTGVRVFLVLPDYSGYERVRDGCITPSMAE
jgi:hypothetical protein